MKLPEVFLDLARMNTTPDGCCNQLSLVLRLTKVGLSKSVKLVRDAVLVQKRLSNLYVVLRTSNDDAFSQQPFQVVWDVGSYLWDVCLQHVA